jgi:hypothetical protein
VFGTDSFTAAEVTRRYGDSGETFEAAVAEWVSGRGVIDARSIGNALKRIVGGRAFVNAGEDIRGLTAGESRRQVIPPSFNSNRRSLVVA